MEEEEKGKSGCRKGKWQAWSGQAVSEPKSFWFIQVCWWVMSALRETTSTFSSYKWGWKECYLLASPGYSAWVIWRKNQRKCSLGTSLRVSPGALPWFMIETVSNFGLSLGNLEARPSCLAVVRVRSLYCVQVTRNDSWLPKCEGDMLLEPATMPKPARDSRHPRSVHGCSWIRSQKWGDDNQEVLLWWPQSNTPFPRTLKRPDFETFCYKQTGFFEEWRLLSKLLGRIQCIPTAHTLPDLCLQHVWWLSQHWPCQTWGINKSIINKSIIKSLYHYNDIRWGFFFE